MRPDQRIVTKLPLNNLWDAHGPLLLTRGRAVGLEQIADILRHGSVSFVVANCGLPLTWVSPEECYRFWKVEVKPHLAEPDVAESGFRLEDFPGGFYYLGSEWGEKETDSVVVLEMFH